MKYIFCFIFNTLFITLPFILIANTPPEIQLATKYNLKHSIDEYWISEKLDGVRGYWTGTDLLTKNGNSLNPPDWFTAQWPKRPIDGELWINRHKFEQIISCVKKIKPTACWEKIRFMIFDLPDSKAIFTHRINDIKNVVNTVNSPYLKEIPQYKLFSIEALNLKLNEVVKHQGEGLMLHFQNAYYRVGRSPDIMKLKPYQDAEAIVLRHIEGKGKYQGLLGAIQVRTADDIIFKIGSGFSDKERKNPPAVGATITFKYNGKTQRGVPKFASFLRIRE